MLTMRNKKKRGHLDTFNISGQLGSATEIPAGYKVEKSLENVIFSYRAIVLDLFYTGLRSVRHSDSKSICLRGGKTRLGAVIPYLV